VNFAEGGFAVGKVEAIENVAREAFRDLTADIFEEVKDGLAQPAGGESAAAEGLVNGSDSTDLEEAGFSVVRVVGEELELGLDHFEVGG
jgi:hypothetical protein